MRNWPVRAWIVAQLALTLLIIGAFDLLGKQLFPRSFGVPERIFMMARSLVLVLVISMPPLLRIRMKEQQATHLDQILESLARVSLYGLIGADRGGRIIYANPAAEMVFDRHDLVGRDLTEIMPERYRDLHQQALIAYLNSGQGPILGREVAVDGLLPGGKEVPLGLTVYPLRGDQIQFWGVVRLLGTAEAEAARLRPPQKIEPE